MRKSAGVTVLFGAATSAAAEDGTTQEFLGAERRAIAAPATAIGDPATAIGAPADAARPADPLDRTPTGGGRPRPPSLAERHPASASASWVRPQPAGAPQVAAPVPAPSSPAAATLAAAIPAAAAVPSGNAEPGPDRGPTPPAAAGHGLVINVSFDPSVSQAPAGFTAAFMDAVQFYESLFSNPITVNIDVGWNEIDGQTLGPGFLGESMPVTTDTYSYAAIRQALAANASGLGDQIAYASLPPTDPTGGSGIYMSTAEAEALGLLPAGGSAVDGWVGFGGGFTYTFDPNDRAVGGAYDFIGVAEHEIAEVLGRFSGLQYGGGLSPQDLFRYASVGNLALGPGYSAYFSIDGGLNAVNKFDFANGGDLGDWAAGSPPDAYNAFLSPGVEETVSPGDLLMMSVLGYNPAPQSMPAPPAPAGLALAPGSDSSQGHDVTNVTAPMVTGTGAAGELITLYDDGVTVVGQAAVGEGGTWTIASSVLPERANLLTAVSSDLFGNSSPASAPLAVTIETAAPPPSMPTLAGGGTITASPTPTLVGTGEAGDAVMVFDNGMLVGNGTVGADGSWSVTTATLPQGVNVLSATEMDLAGNVSPASAALTLTVAGNVFAGNYPNGIVLAYPAVQNPAMVTASGSIGATAGGSAVYGTGAAAWSLANAGAIVGGYIGVDFAAGGSIDNTGVIGGTIGIAMVGGAAAGETVVNAGTIAGSGGTAVLLSGGVERLVVDPGAIFGGAVVANGYGALELAAGGAAGTLSSLGSVFAGFDALTVDAGAQWQLDGDGSGMAVTNDGTITVDQALTLGRVGEDKGAHGTVGIGDGATLVLAAGAAHGQSIDFAGSGDLLQLDRPKDFKARIAGFAAGDAIDLAGRRADAFTYAHGRLILTENGREIATLSFAGRYSAADFQLAGDGNGGTEILFAVPAEPAASALVAAADPPFWAVRG